MFILGGLGLICGACSAVVGAAHPWDQMNTPEMQRLASMAAQAGLSLEAVFIATGVITLVMSLVLIVLALFVRRGGMGAAVTASIFTSIVLLLLALQLVLAAIQMARVQPQNPIGLCFVIVPIGLMVLL